MSDMNNWHIPVLGEGIQKRIEYYHMLLQDKELLPLRKHENLPMVLALNLLYHMKEDVADIRKEILQMIQHILDFTSIEQELEIEINRNINALTKVQGDRLAKHLQSQRKKGEDKSEE